MSDQYYSIEAGGVDKAMLPTATATATPMVSVVAPATLPEGYTFDAEVNGTVLTVTVVSHYTTIDGSLIGFVLISHPNHLFFV
jgi:hypothetical protein